MPTIRKNMADINSSDQALNGLKIKSDTLPNDWYVTLVNPKNGEPGENMTIGRFAELFLNNNKIWTENNDGPTSNLYAGIARKLDAIVIPENEDLNNYKEEGCYRCFLANVVATLANCPTKEAFALIVHRTTAYGYTQRLEVFEPSRHQIFYRTVYNDRWGEWSEISFAATASKTSNALTKTIVEEVPVSADTPMTLQEDGQPVLMTQTVERYEYSVPKMAEAILALQKEIAELKGGAGKE